MAASVGHTRSAPTTGSTPRFRPEQPIASVNNPPIPVKRLSEQRQQVDHLRDEIVRILQETPVRDLRQDIRSGDVLPSDIPPELRRTGQKVRSLIRDRAAGRALARQMISRLNRATAHAYDSPVRSDESRMALNYLNERMSKMSVHALRSTLRAFLRSRGSPQGDVHSGGSRWTAIANASAPNIRRALTTAYSRVLTMG